jgi:hypothetical protein
MGGLAAKSPAAGFTANGAGGGICVTGGADGGVKAAGGTVTGGVYAAGAGAGGGVKAAGGAGAGVYVTACAGGAGGVKTAAGAGAGEAAGACLGADAMSRSSPSSKSSMFKTSRSNNPNSDFFCVSPLSIFCPSQTLHAEHTSVRYIYILHYAKPLCQVFLNKILQNY